MMASPTSNTGIARSITIIVLLACNAFGAYATLGTASRNGLFAALTKAAGPDVRAKSKHFPGGPAPYKTTYTGIAAIDDHLLLLISFFTIILDTTTKTQDVSWVSRYLLTQFLAGWVLLSVEGLRRGNKGRIVSWTGTMGLIFQNLTYTVTVPIYLIIHLLTSPVSSPGGEADIFSIATQDLFLLPFSVIGSFIVPTVMMALPSPSMIAPSAHYSWLALWQIFPVTQSVTHSIYKRITAPINFKPNFHEQIDDLYRLVSVVAFVPQTALLTLAVTPAHVVPDIVVSLLPGLTPQTFEQVDLARAFVPHWPWDAPQTAAAGWKAGAKTSKAEGLVELVKMFLQWDIYCGGLAILAWSAFVYSVARPEKRFLSRVLPRILVWTVFGGPVGAAVMLLWERDVAARQRFTTHADGEMAQPLGTDQKWAVFNS